MNTPPGLLAAGLLFWGWQTNSMLTATLMALALEGSRIVSPRWEFSENDLRRVWSLCTILFLGATVYSFSANDGATGLASFFSGTAASRSESLNKTSQSVLVLIQWLPMIFFPIAAVQAYNARPTIDLRVFSWLLRARAAHGGNPFAAPEIQVAYPFLVICLLGTSTAQVHPETFYGGLLLLLSWTIWCVRSRRFPAGVWLCMLGVVALLGYAGQFGLNRLQKALQRFDTAWFSRFSRSNVDAVGQRTALGTLGELKLSGRIMLRVKTITEPAPPLLRLATYDLFDSPWWLASRKKFQTVTMEAEENTWRFILDKPTRRALRVAGYLPDGQGVLSLPHGTAEVRELNVFTLKTNELGVVRVDWGPGLVDYVCHYDEGATIDSSPEEEDLRVPVTERGALESIVHELGLKQVSQEAAVARVESFFRDHFEYSTFSGRFSRAVKDTPLTRFLTKTRSGHCEYFASATTLLLRAAGIPARYAVGYALMEKQDDSYLVRERHAHAWCLAYVNGAWHDIDTTPGSWGTSEALRASAWEPLRDLFSNLWFSFSKWRWGRTSVRPYLLLALIPPIVLIALRLIFSRRSRLARRAPSGSVAPAVKPGVDSEFYLVEAKLAALGCERTASEPMMQWLNRLALPASNTPERLTALAKLHYRYRFDPRGLTAEERSALRRDAHRWLAEGTQTQGS